MTEHNDDSGPVPGPPPEYCGIFTLGGNIPIQGAWRDITFVPPAGILLADQVV